MNQFIIMKDTSTWLFFTSFVSAIFMVFVPENLTAQKPHREEITVIAPYEPTIGQANKINIQPRIEPLLVPMPPFEIGITPRRLNIKTTIEPMPVIAPAADKQSKLFRNQIKAGFGNYTTPFIEFTANSLQNSNHSLGLYLKHLSSAGTIKGYGFPGFSDNMARAFGQKQFEKLTLSLSAVYQRNVLHHYGFAVDSFPSPTYDFSKDNIRQRYNIAGGDISLASKNKDRQGLHYGSSMQYRYINDLYGTNEHEAGGGVQMKASFDVFNQLDQQQLVMDIGVLHSNTSDSVSNRNNTLVRFAPSLHFRYQEYEIKVGIRMEFDHVFSTRWHLFPVAEAKLGLIEQKLALIAGFDGRVNKNTFQSFAGENPFISSILNYQNSVDKLRFYGNLQGNVANKVDAGFNFAYTLAGKMPFFVNDTLAPFSRFEVIYDDMKVFKVGFTSSYKSSEEFGIILAANFNSYGTDKEAEAWHKPMFNARLQGWYALNSKLSFNASFIANGKSWAKVWNGNSYDKEQVKAWMDISASAKYHYNKQLHFFLDARNLAAQRQFYWHNYPSYRLNVIAGAGFSF
ncbi:MAG: hypothetical protein U1C46_03755 [Bacteroidales bacterium]|nr:hypothetical protein [Bacteroidales bacterium]